MTTISAGDIRVTVDPALGGAIVAFTAGTHEVLRPVRDPHLLAQRNRAAAAYPLIPYANRIDHGRFSFGGETFQLALNFARHAHSIHGNAWEREWDLLAASDRRVHLVLEHRPPEDPAAEWPFRYRAEQILTVDEEGLTLELSIRNTDARPFPAGLGMHPYIARTPGCVLQFGADTVWLNGPDELPRAREAVSGHFDFSEGRRLEPVQIDNCFANWGGRAFVTWPEEGLRLSLEAGLPLDHLQLFTPLGQDYFGLEPVSNEPDAINRIDEDADEGLKILAPGAVLDGRIRFRVERL